MTSPPAATRYEPSTENWCSTGTSTPDHPSYKLGFVPFQHRDEPDHHFVERAYPACWWRGSDGVNDDAVWEFLRPLT